MELKKLIRKQDLLMQNMRKISASYTAGGMTISATMARGENVAHSTAATEDMILVFRSIICILINLEHKLIKGPLFRGLFFVQKKKYQQNHDS
jgi:hypothetical protein